MVEIILLDGSRSGVFLLPSFKRNLDMNHRNRSTLAAKKLLHAFYTQYDLAYAGDLMGTNGYPGIDETILDAIESKIF